MNTRSHETLVVMGGQKNNVSCVFKLEPIKKITTYDLL